MRPSRKFPELRSPRNFFTLIELLIVVAILAILMGLLLPSLRMAKEHAHKMTCVANLKQLGLCVASYCDGQRSFFPSGADLNPCYYMSRMNKSGDLPPGEWQKSKLWETGLAFARNPETPCIIVCPTDLRLQTDKWLYSGGYGGSYGISWGLGGKLVHRIKKPDKTLVLGERAPNVNDQDYMNIWDWSRLASQSGRYKHINSTNVLFADLHIQSMSYTENKNWIICQNP